MAQDSDSLLSDTEILRMTADVVAAYVSNNAVPASQIHDVISIVHQSLNEIDGKMSEPEPEPQKPAVPIKKSITNDYLICLEDGKKLKMLKRHLRSTYGMSPEEYRQKWNLASDYPMVAPAYAAQRSAFAKEIGLGRGRAAATRGGRKRK